MRLIVNIDVPELAPAIAFYTAALGLRLNRILDDDVAELQGADTTPITATTPITLYLLRKPSHSAPAPDAVHAPPPPPRHYTRHWTPVHLDFVVDDLEAAAARARAAGAAQEGDCVVWAGSRCISFADPFGHGFCLIQFIGASGTYATGAA